MNDQEKTKEELIAELGQLKQELASTQHNFAATIAHCKQENSAFQKNESVLKYALEAAAIGFWEWDIANNKVKYSLEWRHMLGFSETEIEDEFEEWQKRVHPDDLENALSTFNNPIKGETDRFGFEHRLLSKSGNYLWVLSEGKIIEYNKEGAPIHAIGTHKDITERKQAELDVQKSESQYRTILNTISDAIVISNLDGEILYISPSTVTMFGLKNPDEIFNHTVNDFISADDKIRARENIAQLLAGNFADSKEYRAVKEDGSIFAVEVDAEFIKEIDKDPYRILYVLRDISQKKPPSNSL
jgi:PAS domain S-box-containing protein